MPKSVRSRIGAALDAIKRDEAVRILYACESGSRAWRFASADSDYDVRFIYARSRTLELCYTTHDAERLGGREGRPWSIGVHSDSSRP